MPLFKRRTPEQPPSEPPEPPEQEMAPTLPPPIELESRPEPEEIRLVGELSAEYLQYIRERFHQQKSRFIRIGDVILLAAPNNPDAQDGRLEHIQMIGLASDDKELAQKIAAAKPTEPIPATGQLREEAIRDGVTDAGWFDFTANDKGEIKTFGVAGASTVYGVADEAGRKKTLKVAAQQLGPNIEIVWGDPH